WWFSMDSLCALLSYGGMKAIPFSLLLIATSSFASDKPDFSPRVEEKQVPRAMHSEMKMLPRITVGQSSADIVGTDNRALQAAVDYIANLGGGIVEIGPGEYLMNDSLHLRSRVTVRGVKGQTVLRKAKAAISLLA